MTRPLRQCGAGSVEYLGVVAAVAILFAGLLTLRPHRVGDRAPVNVIPPIVRLLGTPVENLSPRTPATPRGPVVGRPRPPGIPKPRPPRPEPPVVLLPEWWR